MKKGLSKRKPSGKKWRPSLLTIILILCNLCQAALLALNFYVLGYQRDIIRYLFEQAFTKTQ